MRLPPEILSWIFVFHARMEWRWLNAAFTSTHVCKRWWEIGRACPELWSHINCEDCRSTAWMTTMIRRSGVVPLSLVIDGHSKTQISSEKMALVVSNMHRFTSLNLYVPHGRGDSDFFESFSQSVPLLKSLAISNHGYSIVVFPPEFLGGGAPNLRHMKLNAVELGTLCTPGHSGYRGSRDAWGEDVRAGNPYPPTLLLPSFTFNGGVRPCLSVKSQAVEGDGPLARCTHFLRQITINIGTIVLVYPRRTLKSSSRYSHLISTRPSHPSPKHSDSPGGTIMTSKSTCGLPSRIQWLRHPRTLASGSISTGI
ncbi:hypothetical protein BD779DRAFT_1039098 [Infundibulicybe gibba]|nr:hypothetical protein BD779DRAFT_1039098 [Infundibulicybe gibba]